MKNHDKTITIHIGHHKTGSSAIQAFLGKNVHLMETLGFQYPLSNEFIDRSKKNQITSGNWRELQTVLARLNQKCEHNYLFSSELFFEKLLDKTFRSRLFEASTSSGYKVKFVCYTRDFFEFTFSGWGQYIKRSGGLLNYYDFIMEDCKSYSTLNGSCFDALLEIIELSVQESFELEIYNYDRHRGSGIVQHFLSAVSNDISLDEELLGSNHTVNRSLTNTEYEIQRQFNQYFGKNCNKFISDPLVEQLPNQKSDIPFINENQYHQIIEKKLEIINRINDRVAPSERIQITKYDKLAERYVITEPGRFYLSEHQIQVLTKAISEELRLGLNINLWKLIFRRAFKSLKRWK